MNGSKQISDKLWNYCSILRDDGLSYGDYVEQLTFLLFLKMDDERSRPPHNKKSDIPKNLNWQSLIVEDGAELEAHYIKILNDLGKADGINGIEAPISPDDSLKKNPGAIYDMVLTNPPFGKKSSEKIVTEEGKAATKSLTVLRDDFWAQTSNKQLNFLQHVRSILKISRTATTANKPGPRKRPLTAAGARLILTKSSSATKPISISSGLKMKAWKMSIISPIRM